MLIKFDGKAFAKKKEEELKKKVEGLKSRGLNPKLVSILVGKNPGSALYTRLKKEAAERVGIEFEIRNSLDDIERLNKDPKVHGIMIQMPLPENMLDSKFQILNSISPKKDVDGLRDDSPFLHPTAKAIVQVIEEATQETGLTCVVVGATGMVGRPLVKELGKRGYKVIECNTKTADLKSEALKGDILVSVTGKAGIIKKDMVKEGAIVIDVGYPVGDVETAARERASFVTPVPGGIGPVTISCLLENLVEACYNSS